MAPEQDQNQNPINQTPQGPEPPPPQQPQPQPRPQPLGQDVHQPSSPAGQNNPIPPSPQQPGPAAPKAPASETGSYVSNPFLASVDGLIRILKNNAATVLLATFVGYLLYFTFYIALFFSPLITFFIFIVLGLVFLGTFLAIAAESASGNTVSLSSAIGKGVSKILSLLALVILLTIILTIGFILLVIPGIWLLGRTALAPLVMYSENLGAIKAISRSFELTKGHTIEMLGAYFASTLLVSGYGLIGPAAMLSPIVERYKGIKQLKESEMAKPKIHWLNFLALILPVLFIVAIVAALFMSTFSSINEKASDQQQIDQTIESINSDPAFQQNVEFDYSTDGLSTPSPN